MPAASIARDGFVSDENAAAKALGQEIKLWGFVDHGNLYGDADAKRILQEWWAGDGPGADTWRFNLKAEANDAVGDSFSVHVPNDAGREDLLRRFVADAQAKRPTKVIVRGRLFTFGAPTQTRVLTGLYLEIDASGDIQFAPTESTEGSNTSDHARSAQRTLCTLCGCIIYQSVTVLRDFL